jgi:hypothetical protein
LTVLQSGHDWYDPDAFLPAINGRTPAASLTAVDGDFTHLRQAAGVEMVAKVVAAEL